MPAVTREQFFRVIEMSISRVKNAIITNAPDNRLIKKQYPTGVGFNNKEYMDTLVKIYGEQNDIPEVFTKALDLRICEELKRSVFVTYTLDLLCIIDCLNSVDPDNLTEFELCNYRCRNRVLDVTIRIEETPSVFRQFLEDPRGTIAIFLMLASATFLSMASMGMMIIGATIAAGGIALGTYTFFSTKKPGITSGFSTSPIPEDVTENFMQQEVSDLLARAF